MAKFNQIINFGQTEIPIQNPASFFWRFSAQSPNDKAPLPQWTSVSTSEEEEEEEEEELGLNLCLSLGGVYDPKPTKKEKPLIRSSSIAGEAPAARPFLSLSRSCSLPAESNEEAARLRRIAAKRRLAEKQRSSPAPASVPENSPLPASEVVAWAAASAAKSAALGRAISRIKTHTCRQIEGQEFPTAANNSASVKPFLEQREGVEPPVNPELQQNPLKKIRASSGKVLNNWADVMSRMPSVTTTGDGPNGKRIEGFLYKYTKGQVSIVCVCHGSFLSPAEFVRHAGGKEVANPMRQINVCTALPL